MMTKGKTLNKINELIVLLIIRLAQRAGLFSRFLFFFFFPEASSTTKLNVFTVQLTGRELQLRMELKFWVQRGDLVLPGMLIWLLLFTDM